jgi:hypothetical protein
MRRWVLRFILPAVGAIALVGFFMFPIPLLTPTSGANPIAVATFDIDTPIVPGVGWQVPPNCSNWHELYPNYCQPHHQFRYDDTDSSGTVSVCDNIVEDDRKLCWHVEKVMSTYYFSPVAGGPSYAGEPSVANPGPNPTCDQWHIIHSEGPDFTYCQTVHVQDWYDANHNGQFDVCDDIMMNGQWYHIDRIGCDVQVILNQATGNRHGTWGWLKNLFK